jgi:hypothetical protein
MNEESKLPINCLVFLGRKWNDDGFELPVLDYAPLGSPKR